MTQADFEGDSPVAPLPLRVAALVVLLEGLATVGYGVSTAVNFQLDQWLVGVSVTLFFLLYGGALVLCAWQLTKVNPWARGPVLFAQLVWLGLAWNFRDGDTAWVSAVLALAGIVTLVGMLHRDSIEALESSRG